MSSLPDFFLPVRVLSRVFRGKFLAGLRTAFAAGRLRFRGELASLAKTAGAEVVAQVVQQRTGIDPCTYIGSGKAEEIHKLAHKTHADVVIFDNDMSPNQLRDLEIWLARDQNALGELLVQGAKATSTIAARRQQLSGLVEHADIALQALASQQTNLERGVAKLPVVLHQGNVTFTQLPSALGALHRLVNVSKPNTVDLALLFGGRGGGVNGTRPVGVGPGLGQFGSGSGTGMGF